MQRLLSTRLRPCACRICQSLTVVISATAVAAVESELRPVCPIFQRQVVPFGGRKLLQYNIVSMQVLGHGTRSKAKSVARCSASVAEGADRPCLGSAGALKEQCVPTLSAGCPRSFSRETGPTTMPCGWQDVRHHSPCLCLFRFDSRVSL